MSKNVIRYTKAAYFNIKTLNFFILKMSEWLIYNNGSILANYTDIGQSYNGAIELLNKHEMFHKSCFVSFFFNLFIEIIIINQNKLRMAPQHCNN